MLKTLLPSNSVAMAQMMSRLEAVKTNPSQIQRLHLDTLSEIYAGSIDIVDPTSPFVFLMEMSALNTAMAIQEHRTLLRSQYPSLAQTPEDLYHHLSDVDYIDRFASPASTKVTFMFLLSDVQDKLLWDEQRQLYRCYIPRYTSVSSEPGVTFALDYPIEIVRFDNQTIQVRWVTKTPSKFSTVEANILDYRVVLSPDGLKWLVFEASALQYSVKSVMQTLNKGTTYRQRIPFDDQYFFTRIWQSSAATSGQWVEVKTTHSDQVFDPHTPTVLLRVLDKELEWSIPRIYQTLEAIQGQLRIDIYTTKGAISINMGNYAVNQFKTTLGELDLPVAQTPYAQLLQDLTYQAFISLLVDGGKDSLSFEQLRQRVIFNTEGPQLLPITQNQLQTQASDNDFKLVKHIDTLTDRIFLATRSLPAPSKIKLTTAANIGICTFVVEPDAIRTYPGVWDNNRRLTLGSYCVFENDNSKLTLLPQSTLAGLHALGATQKADVLNAASYLYTPFYYVLDDTNDEFEVRAYHLDQPVASSLSFIEQNETAKLTINTQSYNLEKTASGYRLTVVTKSDAHTKNLLDSEVSLQLALIPDGEVAPVYFNGIFQTRTQDQERIFIVNLPSNHDIDPSHRLCLKSAWMRNGLTSDVWVNLDTVLHLVYATTSIETNFVPGQIDAFMAPAVLPDYSVGVSRASLRANLGAHLSDLWTRCRTLTAAQDYERYTSDVPLFYDQTVYERDPVTSTIFNYSNGSFTYTVLHNKNEPVLDAQGNQVYAHRTGDVVHDAYGTPVLRQGLRAIKEIDLLCVDAKHFFVTDRTFLDYNAELQSVLSQWSTVELTEIKSRLLELTRIYFHPQSSLTSVAGFQADSVEIRIPSEQSFTVDLYVSATVFTDEPVKQGLVDKTVAVLNDQLSKSVVNMKEVLLELNAAYGSAVTSLDVRGLGRSLNLKYFRISEEQKRLCLKKVLQVQQDDSLIVKEDVTVNFLIVER